jgi:hypothetical protein
MIKKIAARRRIRRKRKWKEIGFKYKMKSAIMKMVSKGNTNRKPTKRKSLNI